MRENMHPGWAEPQEERLAGGVGAIDKINTRGEKLLVESLHPRGRQ
jgi:hypothetical protein